MKKTTPLLPIILSFILSASSVHAARIYVESSTTTQPVPAMAFVVKLDTEGSTVNSIDGSLVFVGLKDRILNIHTGGSEFALWPAKPSLSGNVISFVGGTPKGITGSDITLFTVITEPQISTGSYIDFKNILVYTNEQGDVPTVLTQKPILVTSLQQSKSQEKDTTKPSPFTVELAQDSSLFEGKYFISFTTQDNGTGISHYEIQEGKSPVIRSGSPYVLQDQSRKSTITVTAIDNSGNKQTSTLPGKSLPWPTLITMFFLLGGVILYMRRH